MCLDISFKIDITEDSIYDYLPGLELDPQTSLNLEAQAHLLAQSRPLMHVVLRNATGEALLTSMRWGLLREYMFRDPVSFKKYAFNTFNARAETIQDTKSSWHRIRHQRCLIDTPGIYEHRKINGWKHKVPYFIRLKNKKRMLIPALYHYLSLQEDEIQRVIALKDKYMAEALGKTLNIETGEITGSFAMITCAANSLMEDIHNDGPNKHRMPLFMQPEQAVRWIDPKLDDKDLTDMLQYQIPSEELEAWPVFTIRGTAQRPDQKEAFEPFAWPGLPEPGKDDPEPAQQSLF